MRKQQYIVIVRHSAILLFIFTVLLISTNAANANTQVPSNYLSSDWIESKLKTYFKDAPEMVAIAKCESEFRQYNSDGSTLRGGFGGAMIGLFQLNQTYHRDAALSMGFDIDSLFGNIIYAKHLHDAEGTTPWMSSSDCWHEEAMEVTAKKETKNAQVVTAQTSSSANTSADKQATPTAALSEIPETPSAPTVIPASVEATASVSASTGGTITRVLVKGIIHDEVKVLQQKLNARGFTVATEGPGSVGQETVKFGLLTHEAVTKYQCEEKIACAGEEGFGIVGPKTRASLNK